MMQFGAPQRRWLGAARSSGESAGPQPHAHPRDVAGAVERVVC